MPLSPEIIRGTYKPLRMIFWGGLLCIFDITFTTTSNGSGFTFDVLNDVVGCAMIAWGVSRLGPLPVDSRYATVMRLVKAVALLSIPVAFFDQFVFQRPPTLELLEGAFQLVALAATVVFCIAMEWLCQAACLTWSERSWRKTRWLFVLIYAIPLGLIDCVALISSCMGRPFNVNLGIAGLLLLMPIFVVPPVHFFVSTSRMARAVDPNRLD